MSEQTPIDETWYTRPAGLSDRIAGGGVVCRPDGDQVLIALAREGNFPFFVLPKGGVESGESLEEAAQREIHEEIGLTDLRLIRKLSVLERQAYNRAVWTVTHYFLFVTEQIEGIPADPTRHFGVWWHPIDRLPPMFWPEQRRLLEEHRQAIIDAAVN